MTSKMHLYNMIYELSSKYTKRTSNMHLHLGVTDDCSR